MSADSLPEAFDLLFHPIKKLMSFFLSGATDFGRLIQKVAQVALGLGTK